MLFAQHCLFCGFAVPLKNHSTICEDCHSALPWWQAGAACWVCGHPLAEADIDGQAKTCGECLTQPPAFDHLVAGLLYRADSRYCAWQLKFHHQFFHANVLASFLEHNLRAAYPSDWPQVVLPVPLHFLRLFRRGFNQSVEIGRALGRNLAIDCDVAALTRVRHTRIQHRLDKTAREKNVRHAFRLKKPLFVEHVALLDDVVTTGSTVNAIAALLKQSGVKRVDIWCALRASGAD